MKRALALLAVLALLAITAPAQARDSIVIGGTVPLTGPFAPEADVFGKLMDTWAAMVNEKGGFNVKSEGKKLPLKIIYYDDKSDPPTAAKFYERLITVDKVDILIGPYSSPISFPTSAVAEKHGVPIVLTAANSSGLYKRNFKWMVSQDAPGPLWSERYFDMLKATGKAKTIAFVTEDTPHPKDVTDGCRQYAQKAGLEIVLDQAVPKAATDFTPVITQIKAKNPDIVYIAAFPPLAIAFMKQAKELDLNPREFHAIHHGGALRKALGKDAEFVTGENFWLPGMKFGPYQMFEEALRRANFSVLDYPWTVHVVNGLVAIQQAVESADSLKSADLRAALGRVRFESLTGTMFFHETGYGTNQPFPTQIIEGKYQLIWPDDPHYPAKPKHVYPTPPWSQRK